MCDIANNSPSDNPNPASFAAYCRRAAALFARGALTLQQAVDACWSRAQARGIDTLIGVDAVQKIMANAFKEVRNDL